MRYVIRLLIAFVAGAGIGASLLHWSTGDDRYSWVWMAALPITIIGLVLVNVARSFASMAPPDPEAVEAARAAGRLAGAKVLDVRRTGTVINDVPQYDVELLVDPRDRGPYRTVVRELIDAAQMPGRLLGTVLAVVRVGEDAPDVAIVDEPAPPVRIHATPDAPLWERDPDKPVPGRRRPILPVGRKGRGVRFLVYLLIAAVGVAVPTWQQRDDVLLGVRSGGVGHGDASYLSGPGRVAEAVQRFADAAGTTTVTEVLAYDDQVWVTAPVAPGRAAYDTWWAVASNATRERPATIQPDPSEEFDLSAVDWSALPGLYEQAVEASGIPADEISSGHIAAGWIGSDEDRAVTVRVYLSGPYGSYTLEADAQGTPIGAF